MAAVAVPPPSILVIMTMAKAAVKNALRALVPPLAVTGTLGALRARLAGVFYHALPAGAADGAGGAGGAGAGAGAGAADGAGGAGGAGAGAGAGAEGAAAGDAGDGKEEPDGKVDGEVQDDGEPDDDGDDEAKIQANLTAEEIFVMSKADCRAQLRARGLSPKGKLHTLRSRMLRCTRDDREARLAISAANAGMPPPPAQCSPPPPSLLLPVAVSRMSTRWYGEESPYFAKASAIRWARASNAAHDLTFDMSSKELGTRARAATGIPNIGAFRALALTLMSLGMPRSFQDLYKSAEFLMSKATPLSNEGLAYWSVLMALHCRAMEEAGSAPDAIRLPADPCSPEIMSIVSAAVGPSYLARRSSSGAGGTKCTICKKPGHLAGDCRSKDSSCFTCGKSGHQAAYCPSKKRDGAGGGGGSSQGGSKRQRL